jgi:hypothetical protein
LFLQKPAVRTRRSSRQKSQAQEGGGPQTE